MNVFKYAINYDLIVNYIYNKEDYITDTIIDFYREYVFLPNKTKQNIKTIDNIVGEYIKNNRFQEYLKSKLKESIKEPLFLSNLDVYLRKFYRKHKICEIKVDTKWI